MKHPLLCLFLCVCLLLSACGSDPSEEPSAPGSESEVTSLPEDPNAAAVRGYLEELLAANTDGWLPAAGAEAIRESVKQLKAPILTEEDVQRIAHRAAAFYDAACQEERTVRLPACGVLEAVKSDTGALSLYTEHAETYNALLSYTLYLFTPPDYVFWASEVRDALWYEEQLSSTASASALCLPFADAYTNRSGALDAMREKQSYLRLYPLLLSEGERPLDFSYCGTPELLRNGERTALDLYAMAGEGTPFRYLRAKEVTEALLDSYKDTAGDRFIMWVYGEADPSRKCIPFSSGIAQGLREMTALFSSPLLTEEDVLGLLATFHEDAFYQWYAVDFSILLLGAEGEEDLLLPPDVPLNQRTRRVLAYAIDLFTPSAYRYTDLFGLPGTYYALKSEDAGDADYVWVTEAYELYLVDETGGVTPLYTAWEEDVPA